MTAWVIGGRLPRRPDYCLKLNPLKMQVVFCFKKTAGLPPTIQIHSDKQMARARNCQWLYISLSCFDLLLHWHLSLFIFPTCSKICFPVFCVWICLNGSTTKFESRRQIEFLRLMPLLRNSRCSTGLVARSPDPIDSWLALTLKAKHAINTVMFYFHLNKGHKGTRHFRALTSPPPPLTPRAASSHYRLFSKSR